MLEFLSQNWVEITVVLVAVHTCLKSIRDAIDKTPETDDNLFEKFVSFLGRVTAYLVKGKRA